MLGAAVHLDMVNDMDSCVLLSEHLCGHVLSNSHLNIYKTVVSDEILCKLDQNCQIVSFDFWSER